MRNGLIRNRIGLLAVTDARRLDELRLVVDIRRVSASQVRRGRKGTSPELLGTLLAVTARDTPRQFCIQIDRAATRRHTKPRRRNESHTLRRRGSRIHASRAADIGLRIHVGAGIGVGNVPLGHGIIDSASRCKEPVKDPRHLLMDKEKRTQAFAGNPE